VQWRQSPERRNRDVEYEISGTIAQQLLDAKFLTAVQSKTARAANGSPRPMPASEGLATGLAFLTKSLALHGQARKVSMSQPLLFQSITLRGVTAKKSHSAFADVPVFPSDNLLG
jgi:hypothetical protein